MAAQNRGYNIYLCFPDGCRGCRRKKRLKEPTKQQKQEQETMLRARHAFLDRDF